MPRIRSPIEDHEGFPVNIDKSCIGTVKPVTTGGERRVIGW